MITSNFLPRFENDIKEFACDLRSHVFTSQAATANHFGVHPSTISRYERETSSVRMLPPAGYLAELARLIVMRKASNEEEAQELRRGLLKEINQAIRSAYPDQNVLPHWQAVEEMAARFMEQDQIEQTSLSALPLASSKHDWGDAPLREAFFGREEHLARLQRYLVNEQRRLIGLWGAGGVGKTALAARAAQEAASHFEYIIWRSLRNAPTPATLMQNCLLVLEGQKNVPQSDDIESLMMALLTSLRKHRVLLVLDNLESVLQVGSPAGHCRESYEAYCELIRRLGESPHQSCVILTSRERPGVFTRWRSSASVASVQLEGLSLHASRLYLTELGVGEVDDAWTPLIRLYEGNPLMLALSIETVQQVFGGDVTAFLKSEQLAVGDIWTLLDEQIERLSPLEWEIMVWLAIEREPVSVDVLIEDILDDYSHRDIFSALTYLRRRHLVQPLGKGFSLQNVIMEYVSDRLLRQSVENVRSADLHSLDRFSLMKASAMEYIRIHQLHIFIDPLLKFLEVVYGNREAVRARLLTLKDELQRHAPPLPGYAGGNIVNLLARLNDSLDGIDFSTLTLRQAHFRGHGMRRASLRQTYLKNTVFSDVFSTVFGIAFSPDGRYLAAGMDSNEIRLWRMPEGVQEQVLLGHDDTVRAVAFSPDGRLLASCSDDQTIRLWEVTTGRCTATLRGHENRVRAMAFSPDGDFLWSTGDDGSVRQWDVLHKKAIQIKGRHESSVWALAVSPDGQWIATGGRDETIRLWQASGNATRRIATPSFTIWSLAFHPQSHLLAGGMDPEGLWVWDMRTLEKVQQLSGPRGIVWYLAFSLDGEYLASANDDRTVRIWSVGDWQLHRTLLGHTSSLRAIAFSPEARHIASGGRDRTVRIWDRASGESLRVFSSDYGSIISMVFDASGHFIVTGSKDRLLRIWNAETGTLLHRLKGHTDIINAVAAAHRKFVIASGGDDGLLILWDGASGRILRRISVGTSILAVAFSDDDRWLATAGADHAVRVWDLSTGELLEQLEGHTSWVQTLAFLPDGRLVSGGDDAMIFVWDVNTGKRVKTLSGHESWVISLAISPDGRRLVSGGDDAKVLIWDIESAKALKTMTGHETIVWDVAWSPRGDLVASVSADMRTALWNVETGSLFRWLEKQTHRLICVDFDPRGHRLAIAGEEETIRLWEPRSGRQLMSMGPDRLYEGLDITGVEGLTSAQRKSLLALGAIEQIDPNLPSP